jgi:hypothetical protein
MPITNVSSSLLSPSRDASITGSRRPPTGRSTPSPETCRWAMPATEYRAREQGESSASVSPLPLSPSPRGSARTSPVCKIPDFTLQAVEEEDWVESDVEGASEPSEEWIVASLNSLRADFQNIGMKFAAFLGTSYQALRLGRLDGCVQDAIQRVSSFSNQCKPEQIGSPEAFANLVKDGFKELEELEVAFRHLKGTRMAQKPNRVEDIAFTKESASRRKGKLPQMMPIIKMAAASDAQMSELFETTRIRLADIRRLLNPTPVAWN